MFESRNLLAGALALTVKDGLLTLTHEKSNYGRLAGVVTLRVDDNGVPVPMAADAVDQHASADSLAAVRVMRAASRDAIRVSTATTGPATGWHAVCHLPEADTFGADKGAKRRFDKAMALAYRRKLVRKVWHDVGRKAREVWELTEAAATSAHFDEVSA